jgi:signal transduction histidine kinase
MDKMIGSILALSRMGRRKLKPEELDLSMVVRTIQDSLAHQIAERRVDVTVAQLPRVMADKFAMEQVLGNLLDNALKYLDPSRSARVEIGGDSRDGEIVIHVRDNGRGMAKDEIPKAFELFRRVGKQDVPGEGMGLAYVKALVRSMGGRIWCESEPGSGTTFSVAVPSGSGRESGNP